MMKVNIRHQQKVILPIKKYLPIQAMISSYSENSIYPWWSYFNIELFWQYNFSGKIAFLNVSHFYAHYQRSGLF